MQQDFRPEPRDNFPKIEEKRLKPRIFPKIFWTFLIIIFIILGVLFTKAYNLGSKVFVGNGNFFSKIVGIFSHQTLKGEADNQINILLLGYGGEGHDGPYLTDSMILASINPESKQVILTSIPRDYYWPESPYAAKKVNAAFADGLGKNMDFQRAGEEADSVVSNITGLNIPYFAAVDFSGFKKAVDRVGGLDIHVDTTFTDKQYPNNDFGYLPAITFTAGDQHMDGERALEFARSRHGDNNEGSDYARSKRQEKVITAFKNKVEALNLISNTSELNDLINIFADHFHTNMEPGEILHLEQLMNSKDTKILSLSLDPNTGIVCEDTIQPDNQFVIMPCDSSDESKIKSFFANESQYAAIKDEHATVIIENAGNTSLYESIKTDLTNAGATVYEVTYKGLPITQSVLYEANSVPATEKFITDRLGVQAQPKPDTIKANTDLILFVAGK